MTIKILDKDLKGEIMRMEPRRPEDEYRAGVTGTSPIFLFYTRFVWCLSTPLVRALTSTVVRLDTPKRALSRLREPVFSPLGGEQTWA